MSAAAKLKIVGAHLELAEEDAKAATLLVSGENRYAAYHCQQAAEKLIRAVLLHREIRPGLEHRLGVLVDLLPDGDPWKATLQRLDKHTPYATTFRYATPAGRIPSAPASAQVTADVAEIVALLARAREELR